MSNHNRFNEEADLLSQPSIDDLINLSRENGKINVIHPTFLPGEVHKWGHMDIPSTARLSLLDVGHSFRVSDVLGMNVRVATLRHLLNFAIGDWNGIDWIVAFGSICDYKDDYSGTAVLMSDGVTRSLGLVWSRDLRWVSRFRVLCSHD